MFTTFIKHVDNYTNLLIDLYYLYLPGNGEKKTNKHTDTDTHAHTNKSNRTGITGITGDHTKVAMLKAIDDEITSLTCFQQSRHVKHRIRFDRTNPPKTST